MVRYDLAFFLCCCKSFLGSPDADGEEDFYDLLGVERDAAQDEIKRAYKRQSLQMHPDKLAQRGLAVTEADQARFTRMKEAYEVLSDPHKRETYDAIGEKGMKWLEEPFGMDPQELARNFANSSALDRSKIFAIFVAIAVSIFLLPVLVCLQADGAFGSSARWVVVLIPLWFWDLLILFYHSRVIMMGPVHRPDHIPEEDWVDPLPMSKRYLSMARFCLIILFEILVALKLDGILGWPWTEVFFPIYLWLGAMLYKKLPLARMRIVTVEDLETALGKPFTNFTEAEKDLIAKRYSVVPSATSPEFEAAHKLKSRARQDLLKLFFFSLFLCFLLLQLDTSASWNWWLVFVPFWTMSFCICFGKLQNFSEVQREARERDPEFFAQPAGPQPEGAPAAAAAAGAASKETNSSATTAKTAERNKGASTTTSAGTSAITTSTAYVEAGNAAASGTYYGAVGTDGEAGKAAAAAAASAPAPEPLTDEERDELRSQLMQSGYKLVSSCCSQAFILIIVCLFVGKLQGASYSSVWIISPLLIVAGLILCCLGCMIFCITEVPADGVEFDTTHTGFGAAAANYVPPTTAAKPSPSSAGTGTTKAEAPKATWDPERGEVWQNQQQQQEESSQTVATTAAATTTATVAPLEGQGASEQSTPGPVDLLDSAAPATSGGPKKTRTIDELD